jgi:DNA-binding XRE family transcriptional regulator
MLAAAAHISEPTLLDIEKGRTRPHMVTAYAIVDALNSFLRAQGKQEVTIDDIDWTIR